MLRLFVRRLLPFAFSLATLLFVCACSGNSPISAERSVSAAVFTTPLLAGAGRGWPASGSAAGELNVWNDATKLYVRYACAEGWSFAVSYDEKGALQENVHLYVGSALPRTVSPGKFPYKRSIAGANEITFEIPLAEYQDAENLYVAAHADLTDSSGSQETAWGFDINSPGEDDGTSANEVGWFPNLGCDKRWGWVLKYDVVLPAQWPMYGYNPQHTHRAPYNGPTSNALKWSYTTGDDVESSPAIGADGTVYVGSWDGKFYAINPDGSLKWSYTTGGRIAYSSTAIGIDGTLYIGCNDHKLYAINPDGSLKWAYVAGDEVYFSPVLGTDGTIYVGSRDNKLHAISPDGTLKWTYSAGSWVQSPALGLDGTVYTGSGDSMLYAINQDGSLKWTYLTGGPVYGSPSVGADGTVYVGNGDGKLYAISPDGSLEWTYATGAYTLSSPATGADGTIYLGSMDGKFYAIRPDGSLKWSYTTGGPVGTSPTAIGADGLIYMGSYDGKLYALNPDGSLKWSYLTGGIVDSSPAISVDGTLYVGSRDGKLYAFGM